MITALNWAWLHRFVVAYLNAQGPPVLAAGLAREENYSLDRNLAFAILYLELALVYFQAWMWRL